MFKIDIMVFKAPGLYFVIALWTRDTTFKTSPIMLSDARAGLVSVPVTRRARACVRRARAPSLGREVATAAATEEVRAAAMPLERARACVR